MPPKDHSEVTNIRLRICFRIWRVGEINFFFSNIKDTLKTTLCLGDRTKAMLSEVTFATAKAAASRVSRVVQEWLPGEMFLQIRTGLWNKGSL